MVHLSASELATRSASAPRAGRKGLGRYRPDSPRRSGHDLVLHPAPGAREPRRDRRVHRPARRALPVQIYHFHIQRGLPRLWFLESLPAGQAMTPVPSVGVVDYLEG
jgi:hypothetical protein